MSHGPLLLGSDIGSGSCKTVVLDGRGRVVAGASRDYPSSSPHPDWVEQDPEAWYAAFCATTREVLAHDEVDASSLTAACIVGVTHNPVLLAADGRPLRPAIHFWDRRSGDQVRQLAERWGDEVERRALNGLGVLWSWPQLLWVRQHEPQVWQRIATLLFPKDYLRHRLAPSPITDTVDPAGTLLYDPVKRAWIDAFVDDLGLPRSALPEPRPPLEIVGGVARSGAADSGLPEGLALLVGTSDTAAEVVGAGATLPGQAIVKLSSVGRLMVVTERPMPGPNRLNYPHVLAGLWYPGSVTKYGAAAYRWARDALWPDLAGDGAYRTMDRAAADVPAGSDGVLFHPHLLGEFAPQWNPGLRASFSGLTVHHRRPQLTRAVLEGVAFQIRAAFEDLEGAGARWDELRLIGGGATSELWSQIVTDVLQRPLTVPSHRSAAYGAAILAGMATGNVPDDPTALRAFVPIDRESIPQADADTYQRGYLRYLRTGRLLERLDEGG